MSTRLRLTLWYAGVLALAMGASDLLVYTVVRHSLIASSVAQADAILGRLGLAMLIGFPVVLLLATAGGAFLAGRALRPIDELTRLAQRITAEDLSQRLDAELPQDEVGRLAQTLNEMIARLETSFQRQRQFTAEASHELRTPLTAMKGQLEVIQQRERSPEEYRTALEALSHQVERLIRLVGSLLTLARVESGQLETTFEPLRAHDLVAGAVEHLQGMAAERGVELRLEEGPECELQGDENLLLQVLLNLIDNGLKATRPGGSVTVGWSENELWVRDTGVGIGPEHIPHLFERFYRIEKSRSREAGGTGLGLPISQWIAQLHGGELLVDSQPGQGSKFTLRL